MAVGISAADSTPGKPRWYVLTLAKFLLAVLVLQVVLFLSDRYRWFWFNEFKGCTVLMAMAATALSLLLLAGWVVVSRFTRSRSQFSLATLLLMVPVAAVPCCWFARELALARHQREIVDTIHAKGASTVAYTGDHPSLLVPKSVWPWGPEWVHSVLGEDYFHDVFDIFHRGADDADLASFKSFARLRMLRLPDSSITDRGLAHLKDLTGLQWIELDGTRVTDEGLAHLKNLTRVHTLSLNRTRVTDEGMAHLKNMTHLRDLSLEQTKIGDAGLAQLKPLVYLRRLNLNGTQVTDGGMKHLKALPEIEKLSLDGTRITDAGLDQLKSFILLIDLSTDDTQVTAAGRGKLRDARPDIGQH